MILFGNSSVRKTRPLSSVYLLNLYFIQTWVYAYSVFWVVIQYHGNYIVAQISELWLLGDFSRWFLCLFDIFCVLSTSLLSATTSS